MIKYHLIIIKIIAFIDGFTVVFKTRALCSVTFSCSFYMRKHLYRQTGERLHYTRIASYRFTVLDNLVYRHTLKKRTV